MSVCISQYYATNMDYSTICRPPIDTVYRLDSPKRYALGYVSVYVQAIPMT